MPKPKPIRLPFGGIGCLVWFSFLSLATSKASVIKIFTPLSSVFLELTQPLEEFAAPGYI